MAVYPSSAWERELENTARMNRMAMIVIAGQNECQAETPSGEYFCTLAEAHGGSHEAWTCCCGGDGRCGVESGALVRLWSDRGSTTLLPFRRIPGKRHSEPDHSPSKDPE